MHRPAACLQVVQAVEHAVKAAEEVHAKPSLLHIALLKRETKWGTLGRLKQGWQEADEAASGRGEAAALLLL